MNMLFSLRLIFVGLIFAVSTFTAMPVASEPTDEDIQDAVCQFLGKTTEGMAGYRDDGYSKGEIKKMIDDADGDPQKEKLVNAAVDRAFSYPRLSPREEGNRAFMDCIKQFE